MASVWKRILEEEVEQLEYLHSLLHREKDCLARMDREALIRLTREKEALASRMRSLNARREGLDEQDRSSLSNTPEISGLFRTRKSLLEEIRHLSRTHKEIVQTQREQVSEALGFLQRVRCRSATYDSKGNLNRR